MVVVPGISNKEAGGILSKQKFFFPLRLRKKAISPGRIELIYLPFYLFRVVHPHRGQSPDTAGKGDKGLFIVLDGLLGENLFFVGDNLKYTDREDGVENPVCPFIISRAQAERTVVDKYKWLQVEHGLRMKQKPAPGKIDEVKTIFYPFWVGYYRRGGAYDFRVVDGVSGEVQGVRMRKVFLKALRHLGEGTRK
jgi:hypothetical protein